MIVKLKDVVSRVNNNIDRFNTDIEYYLGKGHGECGEIAITERGNLKKDVGMLGFKFHFAFEPGDSLFFSRSFALRKAGMAMYTGICSDSTYILRTKDINMLLPDYLPAIIQSDVFWEYCDTHHTGGVNFLINWSTLADYEFELPTIAEQKVLADKLWAAYRLKESYKKLLVATQEMVKSQFIEMFGTLEEPKFKTGYITDISENLDAMRIPIKSGNRKEGKYPYYGASGVVDYVSDYIFDENILLISEDGANLKDRVTPIAFSSSGKVWVNNHAHVLRFENPSLQRYVEHYFNYNRIDSYLTGTAQPKLNQDKLNSIPIPIPDTNKIIRFEEVSHQADKSGFELRKSIESIDAVIKSLINS